MDTEELKEQFERLDSSIFLENGWDKFFCSSVSSFAEVLQYNYRIEIWTVSAKN